MVQRYQFDTSIWLDFFENRSEPNLPKSEWAHKLVNKILKDNSIILFSDVNMLELKAIGYLSEEINNLLKELMPLLIFIESTERQIGKAKDLGLKRDIPKRDALHALIARDNKAILVALDNHFQKILDIIMSKKPKDLI